MIVSKLGKMNRELDNFVFTYYLALRGTGICVKCLMP